jgi:hypothetical protein
MQSPTLVSVACMHSASSRMQTSTTPSSATTAATREADSHAAMLHALLPATGKLHDESAQRASGGGSMTQLAACVLTQHVSGHIPEVSCSRH